MKVAPESEIPINDDDFKQILPENKCDLDISNDKRKKFMRNIYQKSPVTGIARDLGLTDEDVNRFVFVVMDGNTK